MVEAVEVKQTFYVPPKPMHHQTEQLQRHPQPSTYLAAAALLLMLIASARHRFPKKRGDH